MRIISIALFLFALTCGASVASAQDAGMNQKQLLVELDKVIDVAKKSADPEVQAAAAVLMTLKGSLMTNRAREFLNSAVTPFTLKEIERLEMLRGQRKS